jgi:hypothetical protein
MSRTLLNTNTLQFAEYSITITEELWRYRYE